MQRKKKGLSILLAGTVALGALAVLPVGEIQAKAAISQQTKGSSLANTVTAATAKQAATDTTQRQRIKRLLHSWRLKVLITIS
ncbi:PIII-type proteinase [Lactococcus lactis]|nr:PIII-type proteinase [Lactococcus lactis]